MNFTGLLDDYLVIEQTFCDFIKDALSEKNPGAEKRHKICGEMQKYHDDLNSERVFRMLGIEGDVL